MPWKAAEKCTVVVKSYSRCCFCSLKQTAMALWSAIAQLLFTQIFGVWWLLNLSGSKFYLPVMPLRIWSSAQYSEILRPSQFNFSCLFLLSLFYRLQRNIVELFPFLKTLLCWFPHVFVLTSFLFCFILFFLHFSQVCPVKVSSVSLWATICARNLFDFVFSFWMFHTVIQ